MRPKPDDALLPLVYAHLRAIAGRYFRSQPEGHTLQPTALVHEAWLKVAGEPEAAFEDRTHFTAVAAVAMRQVLTDHARRRAAHKRGGPERHRVTLSALSADSKAIVDVLAVDQLLVRLEGVDPRRAKVVELRFFGGLSVSEVADVLGVSKRTVEGDWRSAKAWLHLELSRL